jgi:hypothetical protein
MDLNDDLFQRRVFLMNAIKNLIKKNQDTMELPCSIPENIVSVKFQDEEAKYIRQYQIPLFQMSFIDKDIKEWLEKGLIELGNPESRWNSLLLSVPKLDSGSLWTMLLKERRTCIDLRHFNSVYAKTYPNDKNSYDTIPKINDLLEILAGSKFFSELDLKSGFQQFEIEESSRDYFSFI